MSALISYYTKLPEALEMAAKLAKDFDVLFVVNAKWDASPRPADLHLSSLFVGHGRVRVPVISLFVLTVL